MKLNRYLVVAMSVIASVAGSALLTSCGGEEKEDRPARTIPASLTGQPEPVDSPMILQEMESSVERALADADESGKTLRDKKCVAECKRRHRDKVNVARKLFNSKGSAHYRDLQWLKSALDAARSEFDSCLSTCD